jgi:poly(3-hydroxybutyrate) depolymerase
MLERVGCVAVALLGAAYVWPAQPPSPQGVPASSAHAVTFHSTVDDSEQPYALYLPPTFSRARKYPLVVSLHSEDSTQRLNLRQLFGIAARYGETDPPDLRYFPVKHPVDFIVACPSARGVMGYQGIAEQDVYDMLADVEHRLPVDEDRVYLTGISMGGGGALWLALSRPDVWAATAPLCPVAPPGAWENAVNASNLAVRLFQGEIDPIVASAKTRSWQRRFLDAGVPADYLEYPGVRHNVWDFAYRENAIFEWFGSLHRNRYPQRVRFVTRSYRYARAYWLNLDGLTPGTEASVDALWTSRTALKVDTAAVDGFTVTLAQVPTTAITTLIDGITLKVRPAASLSFSRASGQWRAGRFIPTGKRPGLEGPIWQAVASRHIYVYGSAGVPTPEELERRRTRAETAADWSTPRAHLALKLPVKADSAITPADLDSADLVLFGSAETNTLISRFADRLPLALNPGAADYGLLFIAPIGKHYALVSSGLPWWTGAEEARPAIGTLFAPPQFRLLQTFGDYILFKGSLANVMAEGRFDHNWKLPPDAAAKMVATGTVIVH